MTGSALKSSSVCLRVFVTYVKPALACVADAGIPNAEVCSIAFHAGLQPIHQTYSAVIYSFARSGQLQQAEGVLGQMPETQMRSGWLVLVKQLLARGHTEAAQTCLQQRSRQWLPDADIYEHIIRNVCKDQTDDALYLLEPHFRQQQAAAAALSENGGFDAASAVQTGFGHSSDLPADDPLAGQLPSTGATVDSIWADMKVRLSSTSHAQSIPHLLCTLQKASCVAAFAFLA